MAAKEKISGKTLEEKIRGAFSKGLDTSKTEKQSDAFGLDPKDLLEKLFFQFKQNFRFIARKFDKEALAELIREIDEPEKIDEIIAVYSDYHDNTEMVSTKFNRAGLAAFKRFYEDVINPK